MSVMLEWMNRFLKKYKRRDEDPQVVSYQALRKTIGWLGILLPFVMIIGAWLFWGCTTLQPSISHYFYTNMREVFVGVLCAVALFLFTYTGPNKVDGWVSNVAGVFALGVALFPTTVLCKSFTGFTTEFVCFPCQQHVTSLTRIPYHATLHFICAALFFIILGLMSVFLFRLSDCPKAQQSPQKRKRNVVFLVCGLVIFASIGAAGIYMLLARYDEQSTFILWSEAIALLAFGISWLTKGEAYLKDKPDYTAKRMSKIGSVS
jgi:hypothetical protein